MTLLRSYETNSDMIIRIIFYILIPFILIFIIFIFKQDDQEWECESGISMFRDTTNLCRRKVEGGWLIISKNGKEINPYFFPDKNHKWEIK